MTEDEILSMRCPNNKGGGAHHFTSKATNKGIIVSCLTCKKTKKQLIEEYNDK